MEADELDEMIFGRRYRATEKIGSGGMAEVYKAVDETLGRTVAVKIMHPRYASDPTFTARFRQEAQAAANLQSPYIVNIYDWGQDGDTYYIVMEYVRGTDLKSIIEDRGALDSRRAAEIGSQVCAALSVAHGYDVIHRDIKPHNIMVTPDGGVKVMDFGIARAGNTTMTQTGSVLGTAHYVSPEQAQGRELRAPSDLYSLGIVLYEASTGKLPFDADTPVAVALKQVNEQPVRPTKVNPNVSPDLERVIGRALAKDPARRYATAEEMRRDLLKVVTGEGGVGAIPAVVAVSDGTAVLQPVGSDNYDAPVVRPGDQKRKVWPWIVLAAVLVAAGLAVAAAMGLLGPQGLPVPDVTGKRQVEAEATLVEAGFMIGEVEQVFDDEVAGLVIDQSPVANATAEKGSRINLTVSKGPEVVQVPKLIGLTEEDAQRELTAAGLIPQPLPDEYSATIDAGVIFKQQPAPGEPAEKNTPVQYVVSRGVETTIVPNVTGMSRANAESKLRDAGFQVKSSDQFSESVKTGVVISQNPQEKLKVAVGSLVRIVVSKGSERVPVPDVIGRTVIDATAVLEAAGFEVELTYEPHSEAGTVLDQDPSPGTAVTKGSTITLLVDQTAP
ncbi:MAG: Stk1 family PASTA domain-containing Ser/Thr kinase [Coriobacteriia bacterium]|nr:Stk1 family PASTA domain-containing Ser/Thr kinase [Coriobacteriia bacterium]